MTVYIIISRDDFDFIEGSIDPDKAKQIQTEQTEKEEMRGGRPSVSIREIWINT